MKVVVTSISVAKIFDKLNVVYGYENITTGQIYVGKSKANTNRISRYYSYEITVVDNELLKKDMQKYLDEKIDISSVFRIYILAVLPLEKTKNYDLLSQVESYYVNKYKKISKVYNDTYNVKYEINDIEKKLFDECIDEISYSAMSKYYYIYLQRSCFEKIKDIIITVNELNIDDNLCKFIEGIKKVSELKSAIIYDSKEYLICSNDKEPNVEQLLAYYRGRINTYKTHNLYQAIENYINSKNISEFKIIVKKRADARKNNIKVYENYMSVPVECTIYSLQENFENLPRANYKEDININIYY